MKFSYTVFTFDAQITNNFNNKLMEIQITNIKEISKLWIIFFSTATWLLSCGIFSLVVLECLGLCLDGLLTCLHVGGHLVDQGVLLFGKWRLFVSFDAYGGKETI
jgi:hypothetical protein